MQRELGKASGRKDQVDYLLRRGIVVEPTGQGLWAALASAPDFQVGLSPQTAKRIRASGHTGEDFRRIRERLRDPLVKTLLTGAAERENSGIRYKLNPLTANRVKNTRDTVPSPARLRNRVSGYCKSPNPQLYRQGLYDLLSSERAEQEDEQQQDWSSRRKRHPRLSSET